MDVQSQDKEVVKAKNYIMVLKTISLHNLLREYHLSSPLSYIDVHRGPASFLDNQLSVVPFWMLHHSSSE